MAHFFIRLRSAQIVHLLTLSILCALLSFTLATPSARAQSESEMSHAFPERYFAPYLDMSRYPAMAMATIAEESGIRFFTLAFILNGGGDCRATWAGAVPLRASTQSFLLKDLARLREMGGDVIVSFGGAAGVELAQACTDVESLQAQYQAVIDFLGVTHLDFDIEGDLMEETESVERRSQAIAALQAAADADGRALVIAFTLPTRVTGLTDGGIAVLQSAIDAGVRVDVVNIMTMNFGEGGIPDKMGDNTIQAANSLFEQLKALYPEKSDEALWTMIGLTPMIGINDARPEIFTPTDAQQVTDFALDKNLRWIAMWNLDRDEECLSQSAVLSPQCSGILQTPRQFASTFKTFTTQSE
jgi:chitinase